MKNNFLSKAYGGVMEARHKFNGLGLPRQWKVITSTLLLLFTFAIGNVWAAESATNNPATVEYGTGSAKKTFLDVSNTVSNATISTGSVACVTYGLFELDKNWKPAFYSGPANGSSSSFNYSGATSVGFMEGSSAGSGTAANKSATSGYGAAKYKSTAPATIYVTGITGIAVMGKDADTKNEKRLYIKVEEYAADGTCTPVGEGDGVTKSEYNKSLHITTFDAGTLSGTKYYKVTLYAGYDTNHETSQIRFTKYIIPTTKYTVTYKAGEGTGDDVVDSDAKTVKAFADCSFTAPTGYEFKEWQDGSSNVVAAGATVSADMTLTAIYRLIPTKYTVTYSLNGASGDAPTETDKAEGDVFNLAAAPSWAGHAFDGWLCSADAAVKAAGSSYTMTAAPTTFTAQWHELECKIYSFTGGIGSATAQTANATVDAEKMFVKDSGDKIRLTPATGESFKVGDILTFSGNLNNSAKKFGLKLYADGGSSVSQTIENAAGTVPMICSAALTFNADYIDFARADGTGTTVYTCEVHRACAEGVAAGLSYAETSVGKYSSDAAFTNPLTNANNLVVVYGSSDNAVATIDANGQVTIVGMGTATITAKSAVQTKAGTLYAAGTASYTLTVAAPPTFAVTYANNGGDGTMTDSNSPYAEGAEVTLLDNTFTAPSGYAWSAWVVTETVSGNPVAVSEGKFTMPGVAVTVTAQWQLISDFDVKFFQGYGDPDVQIGETQSISTGNYAVVPADPTRTGFAFLGWSYDATEAHIVDVAAYGITAATNFTAMWKAVWTVTFDGAGNVIVEDGEAVASPDSPTQAGKVFQGWYNGESKYDFSAAVTANLALESKWAAADPNHFYYTYNDDFHFDGVVYKTPEGKTTDPEAAEATLNMTTPYTVYSGAEGITSIIATNGVYDYKKGADTKHVTAYLKLKKNDATSNLAFTIKSGYTAVLKIKMGGYSNNPVVTLKKGDDAVPATSGTIGGTATGKNYNEITYDLTAGTYVMTSADQTLYISHIDLEATALPTHTVTYKAGDGTGADVVDADATEVADCPGTFTAPDGKVFNGWKNESDASDVAVGAIVEDDMNLIAQWINHYAVTFNMNGHGDAIDPQDIKEGAKAAKPADPSESGWDFGGWFTDNGTFEAPFDFNTLITAATPLYAKWTADPCPDKKSIVKAVMATNTTATVTGYNSNEYAGGFIINNLADDASNTNMYDFGEGEVKGFKLKGSNSAIFATLSKGGFVAGDQVVFAVTKNAGDNKLAIYAAKDKDNVLKLVELDVDAAGIYTYRLTQDNIDAIEAAGSDYLSIGTFRGDYNPYIYSVELKGCRSWAIFHTLTFKNIDGTATIAAESLEEGAYASTVAPAAPKIAMKRFVGWSESKGGSTVDLTTYTITEDKTLYAVYEDIVCPTTGTVYKFEIKDELPSENLPTSTDKDMSSYIMTTGDGYLTYTATANNKATINSDGTIQMKDASAAYLKVELECALAAGDQIRAHITGNPMRVQVAATYDSGKDLILAKNAYEFVAITSAMEGKQVLYITRSSNGNANLADFEIYRPAKYDVSFNMMGHGSAIADLEDVVEGSKIAAPSPAPTDADYSFAGWYKERTSGNSM